MIPATIADEPADRLVEPVIGLTGSVGLVIVAVVVLIGCLVGMSTVHMKAMANPEVGEGDRTLVSPGADSPGSQASGLATNVDKSGAKMNLLPLPLGM